MPTAASIAALDDSGGPSSEEIATPSMRSGTVAHPSPQTPDNAFTTDVHGRGSGPRTPSWTGGGDGVAGSMVTSLRWTRKNIVFPNMIDNGNRSNEPRRWSRRLASSPQGPQQQQPKSSQRRHLRADGTSETNKSPNQRRANMKRIILRPYKDKSFPSSTGPLPVNPLQSTPRLSSPYINNSTAFRSTATYSWYTTDNSDGASADVSSSNNKFLTLYLTALSLGLFLWVLYLLLPKGARKAFCRAMPKRYAKSRRKKLKLNSELPGWWVGVHARGSISTGGGGANTPSSIVSPPQSNPNNNNNKNNPSSSEIMQDVSTSIVTGNSTALGGYNLSETQMRSKVAAERIQHQILENGKKRRMLESQRKVDELLQRKGRGVLSRDEKGMSRTIDDGGGGEVGVGMPPRQLIHSGAQSGHQVDRTANSSSNRWMTGTMDHSTSNDTGTASEEEERQRQRGKQLSPTPPPEIDFSSTTTSSNATPANPALSRRTPSPTLPPISPTSSQRQQQQEQHHHHRAPSPVHPAASESPPSELILSQTMQSLRSTGVRLLAHGVQCKPKRVWIKLGARAVTWQTESTPRKLTKKRGTSSPSTTAPGSGTAEEAARTVTLRGSLHAIPLHDILYVDIGKQTQAFKKLDSASIPETQCFSLLTKSGSLDLQSESPLQRDAVVGCFSLVLDEVHSSDWRLLYEDLAQRRAADSGSDTTSGTGENSTVGSSSV